MNFNYTYRKCQRACEKLDQQESIDRPAMEWFWPLRKTEESTEDVRSCSDSEESEPENDENIYKVICVKKNCFIKP